MTADSQVLSTRAADTAPAVTGSANPTGAQLAASFPPRPAASSWPATEATRSEVLARVLCAPFALDNRLSQQTRRLGVLAVLGWLRARSGESWQQRWRASGAEDQPDWRRLVGSDRAKPPPHLSPGLLVLICADVIRPSLDWLLRFAPARHNLAVEMARTRDPWGAFTALTALCHSGRVGLQSQQQALTNVAIIMAAKGGPVEQVRVGDCVELLATVARTRATTARHLNSPLFYQLLRAHGDLGPDAPAAIEMFSGRGQPSCEALIDRYRIACRPVRDVLVDYLRERQPSMDFSSLQRHAYLLGKLFWADLEAHHPGIDSLQLFPRCRRGVEATGDVPYPHHDHTRPRTSHDDRAAIGRAQRAHRRPSLLPRHRRVGRRRPVPMGPLGGALPGQRQRRLAQEGPLTPQVPHGRAHPRTASGAAGAGLLGGGRTHPYRRAARRRRAGPAR